MENSELTTFAAVIAAIASVISVVISAFAAFWLQKLSISAQRDLLDRQANLTRYSRLTDEVRHQITSRATVLSDALAAFQKFKDALRYVMMSSKHGGATSQVALERLRHSQGLIEHACGMVKNWAHVDPDARKRIHETKNETMEVVARVEEIIGDAPRVPAFPDEFLQTLHDNLMRADEAQHLLRDLLNKNDQRMADAVEAGTALDRGSTGISD
jgi:hypothetical protein